MQFEINFRRHEVYECGALLLTLLATPDARSEPRNSELYLSLCAKGLWQRFLENPDDWTPITVKPPYVFRDPKIIARDVAYVARRLGERMVAARMAIAFFQQAALGGLKPLPKGIKRLSVNQMAEFVLDDAGQSDSGNVERRFWAPSRPVIHLAAAAAIVEQQVRKDGNELALESLLADRGLIKAIVKMAAELEKIAAADPKFPVKAEKLIRVHLN